MTHFGLNIPIFRAKKIFLENPALSHTTSHGFLAPCQNLEKVNDTIQRKCPDRQIDGRKERQKDRQKDRQTLFYRTLPATTGGPKSGPALILKIRKSPNFGVNQQDYYLQLFQRFSKQ